MSETRVHSSKKCRCALIIAVSYVLLIGVFLLVLLFVCRPNSPPAAQSSPISPLFPDYIDFRLGSDPILLEIPHGGRVEQAGSMQPRSRYGCRIGGLCYWADNLCERVGANRTTCKATSVFDENTREIGIQMRGELWSKYGINASLIALKLSRKLIDANRGERDACQNVPACIRVYRDYHRLIWQFLLAKANRSKAALIINLHGQGHVPFRIEVGYRLNKRDLNKAQSNPSLWQSSAWSEKSSISALLSRTQKNSQLRDLVIGPHSLGDYLEAENFVSEPSSKRVAPGQKKYYRGGHNTDVYSNFDTCTDAIQLELPKNARISAFSSNLVEKWSNLTRAVAKFYRKWNYARGYCPDPK